MTPIQNNDQLAAALATAKQATILARSLTTEMDAEVTAVKAKFEGKIKTRTDEIDAATKAVHVYVNANRAALLPDKAKSTTLNGHEFGFRDNGGAIKTASKVTEKKLLDRLMARPQLRKLFVREKPSLDKDAMKTKWRQFRDKLTALGARLVHTESFFIELDVSEDPKEAASAK